MAPAHLSDVAQAAWAELAASMTPAPEAIEAPGLEAYAVAVARMRDAQRRIDVEGMIISDPKGVPIPHPALAIERAAAAEVKRWLERYRARPRRSS